VAAHKLQPLTPPAQPGPEALAAVGRIACDGEGKLNERSILLEPSRALGAGLRVRLALNALPSFSLFPGQVRSVCKRRALCAHLSVCASLCLCMFLCLGVLCCAGTEGMGVGRLSAWWASTIPASRLQCRTFATYAQSFRALPDTMDARMSMYMLMPTCTHGVKQGAPARMEATKAADVQEYSYGAAHQAGRPLHVIIGTVHTRTRRLRLRNTHTSIPLHICTRAYVRAFFCIDTRERGRRVDSRGAVLA
jgi:hypothetical protein